MGEIRERKVVCIPAKSGVVMSELAKYKLSALVPAGKLTTETEMEKYLVKLFETNWVHFRSDSAIMMQYLLNGGSIESFNRHRIISDGGFAAILDEEKLLSEGFEFVSDQRTKYGLKIKDFKNYLFDFEKECKFQRKDFEEFITEDKI